MRDIIVQDIDPFAPSARPTRRKWHPARTQENGRVTQWRYMGHLIGETHNSAGLLVFKVTFPSGKHCYQSTRAAAEEYAEDHLERT
jgi:hypothetical protein